MVLAKKLLQQLLTPILERQLAFNTATARLTSSLWKQVATLYQQQETALQALQEQLWGGAQQHTGALQALRAEMVALGQAQSDALPALRAEDGEQLRTRLRSDALQALRLEAEKGAAERDARMVEGERTIAQLKTESILQERRITYC